MNKDNLGHSFNKLMSECFYTYRGGLIERTSSGYIWNGNYYSAPEAAEKAIDEAYGFIKNSIRVASTHKKSIWHRFRFWLLGK